MPIVCCSLPDCPVEVTITGDGSTPFSHDENGNKVFFCTESHRERFDCGGKVETLEEQFALTGLLNQETADPLGPPSHLDLD